MGKRSPQLIVSDSGQQERSRSLSPVPTEDLYSYRKSPLPKHRTPPSVTLSSHRGPTTGSSGQTSSTSQTGFANCHKEKVIIDGRLQPAVLTEAAQVSKSHNGIQRRATEVNSREMSQLSRRGSSTVLSNSAHLSGSRSSINHSPSSPDLKLLVEDGPPSSEQLRRKKNHTNIHTKSATLTKHQYSSSPNFFSGSTDSLGGVSNGRGGTGSNNNSLMKLSERQDSSLSLFSVASWTGGSSNTASGALAASAIVGEGEQGCTGKLEAAVMDLYILKQSSDFCHQLCVTWVNVKIVSKYNITFNFHTQFSGISCRSL